MAMPYWFDGNNLIGQSAAASREDARARKAFLSALYSYHKSGGGKFLVYFDGDDSERSAAPTGIAVRYSAPVSTDEAILTRLREVGNPSEVTVVTNDRELKARCRGAGAAVLTWSEFTTRMGSRRIPERGSGGPRRLPQKNGNEQPERVDIDEWMRYFGLKE